MTDGIKGHEGPCCPACMKIAAALEATGELDPMYSGSIRCCCHAEMGESETATPEDLLLLNYLPLDHWTGEE